MRRLNLILSIITAVTLTSGFQCGDCLHEYCFNDFPVRFLSKADNSDLFSNGIYNADSVQVFLIQTDSTVINYPYYSVYPDSNGTAFYLQLAANYSAFIFQFNPQERDTLRLDFYLEETKCCGKMPNFTFGIFQSEKVYVERDGFLKLKK